MRVGIIGATGNAGPALCAGAVNRGHQVMAMVREQDTATALLGPDVAVLAACRGKGDAPLQRSVCVEDGELLERA
jgi:putative NADH-flavin reductase